MKFEEKKINEFNLIEKIEYKNFVKLSGKWFVVKRLKFNHISIPDGRMHDIQKCELNILHM